MRKNIKGIAAGSLGLLALQLPGMTVFAQAADRKARLANALQNTVLGMGTVFVMLIAIALIIYCFKIIPVIQKKFAKKAKRELTKGRGRGMIAKLSRKGRSARPLTVTKTETCC